MNSKFLPFNFELIIICYFEFFVKRRVLQANILL